MGVQKILMADIGKQDDFTIAFVNWFKLPHSFPQNENEVLILKFYIRMRITFTGY